MDERGGQLMRVLKHAWTLPFFRLSGGTPHMLRLGTIDACATNIIDEAYPTSNLLQKLLVQELCARSIQNGSHAQA